MSVVAIDLETVPDVELGRRAWKLEGDDATVRQAMVEKRLKDTDGRSDFFPPPFHRVVAFAVAAYRFDDRDMGFSADHMAGPEEKPLLRAIMAQFKTRPQIVTWNGRAFDFPVLLHRCLLHSLPLDRIYERPARGEDTYEYRYGRKHVDLMEELNWHRAARSSTLHDVAVLAGLPGKTGDGADVERLVTEERWDELGAYVQNDAVMTLLLFLRWEATCGRLPPEPFLRAREHFGLAPALAGAAE